MSKTHRLHTEQWCVRSGLGPSHFLHRLTLLFPADPALTASPVSGALISCTAVDGRLHPQYSGHCGDLASCVSHRISRSVDIGPFGFLAKALGDGYPGGTLHTR